MDNATQTISRGVYVVFQGTKQTPFIHNKRRAIRFANKHKGAQVYGLDKGHYRDGRYPYGWDGPTFRICGTLIHTSKLAA